ncbi:HAD family hydrolase [Paraburkholderia acidicola]|uniref:HAD family hydrolase n=1 Tax=Paraburkholderia acidicola TaxID=1912599 RepID=A0ABV1LQG8_9BURK
MRTRAVLFDLDDTLHDKSATLRAVSASQFRNFQLGTIGVNREEWESAFVELNNLRIEKTDVFRRLGQRFEISADRIALLLKDFDENLGKSARPYPGVFELLTSCKKQGFKIGIVTNGRDAFQRSKISGMGIEPLVDAVITSGGFGVRKPDPRIFHACLDALRVTPSEASFVGDDFDADMLPSIALGMRAVWKSSSASSAVAYSSDSLDEIRIFLLENA